MPVPLLPGMALSNEVGYFCGALLAFSSRCHFSDPAQLTRFRMRSLCGPQPGYYEQGSYGIRTESIVIVHEVKTRRDFGGKKVS